MFASPFPIIPGGSHYYFPKGEEQLRDDFNKALREIISDGTAKKIQEKYYPGEPYFLTIEYLDKVDALIKEDLKE